MGASFRPLSNGLGKLTNARPRRRLPHNIRKAKTEKRKAKNEKKDPLPNREVSGSGLRFLVFSSYLPSGARCHPGASGSRRASRHIVETAQVHVTCDRFYFLALDQDLDAANFFEVGTERPDNGIHRHLFRFNPGGGAVV